MNKSCARHLQGYWNMKKKLFVTALAFLAICSSTLFFGCSSRYDGVPQDARIYWDYILEQYANPVDLQYVNCMSLISDNGLSGVMSLMFRFSFLQVLGNESAEMQQLKDEYRISDNVPPVSRIETVSSYSKEAQEMLHSQIGIAVIYYRVPGNDGKYQDHNQMFVIKPYTDVAYVLPENK